MSTRTWRVCTGVFLALATAFVVASLFVVYRQAIYIPYWDQWGWLNRYASGEETFLALAFTPNNGHIVAVPALLYGIDAWLFGASNVVNLTGMIGCIVGICLVLSAHFARLGEAYRGRVASVYLATAAVLMVWFHNWENLFWPFQAHQYVSVLLSLLALSALTAALVATSRRAAAIGLGAALAAGVLATVSFGAGLGVWGAGAAVVLLGGWRARWKLGVAALALGGAAAVALYLMPQAVQGMPSPDPGDVLGILGFVAQFLGSPFVHGGNERVLAPDPRILVVATATGSAGLTLACFATVRLVRLRGRRGLGRSELFFVGVMAFALAAAVMAAMARGTIGPPWRALSSRYGVLCLLFWLSAVPLLASGIALSQTTRRWLEATVPIGLLAVLVPSQLDYLGWWMKWRSMVEGAGASLVSGVPDADYLGYIFPPPEVRYVEEATPLLLRERLTPIYAARSRYLGHPVAEFGTVGADCGARITETRRLPAGFRISGTLTDVGLPFAEQPVFVVDRDGRIVGVGTVDRGWWWGVRGGLADRTRPWVAFAPGEPSTLGSLRIYATVGRRLCAVPQAAPAR